MSDTVAVFANRRANRRWLERVLTDDGALRLASGPTAATVAVADLADGLESVLTLMADHPELPLIVCHEEGHDDRCRLLLRAGAAECIRLDAAGVRLRTAAVRVSRTGASGAAMLAPRLEMMERIFTTTSDRSLDTAAQIDEVLRLGCHLFDEEIGLVSRITGDRYSVMHVHDTHGRIRSGDRFETRTTFCSITMEEDRPFGIPDVTRSRWRTHPAASTGIESYIGVPIRLEDRVYGTLGFCGLVAHDSPFRSRDLHFAAALGEWVGTLLTREQRLRELESLVTLDQLTGLPNREAILGRLERSVRRAEQSREYGFALLFIDLDGAEAPGFTVGHPAWDTLLGQVSREIRAVVRPKDGVGRFADDEFVVLLEDTDLGGARVVADRIVDALSGPFAIGGRTVRIGASVGVAMGTSSDSARELVIAADEAMYTAKTTGRSVVSVPAGADG